ncbi:MAG: flippase [Eubacteriales bacterium]
MVTTFKKILRSKLIRSAGVYTISNLLNKAIPFFLLPLLTRYLTPQDYGIVSMFGVLVSLITPLTGINLHSAIERMYFEKETLDIREYIANSLLLLIISTAIVSVIFYYFAQPIANLISLPTKLLWIAIVVSFAQFVSQIVLKLWQVQVKPFQYGIFKISETFLNAMLSIWLVVSVGMAWQGRIWAQFITVVIYFIIGMFMLFNNGWLKFKYNSDYVKHALGFGLPLIPHALTRVIMTMTDRIFITNMVGIETTGIYTVGYQIGMVINLLAQSFSVAYTPWLFEKLKTNLYNVKIKIVKLTYVYFVGILALALGFSLLAPRFMNIFLGKEFSESSTYVTWVALGYAFNGMYMMIGKYIFYAQKTKYLAGITMGAGVLNIVLNYVLISWYGAIGAAQATTIIYFLKFILVWMLSAKVYSMPWNLRRVKK